MAITETKSGKPGPIRVGVAMLGVGSVITGSVKWCWDALTSDGEGMFWDQEMIKYGLFLIAVTTGSYMLRVSFDDILDSGESKK